MTIELVVLGWGNPSRGDDALAPQLCDRLEAWLPTSPAAGRVAVVQDFQLQVEHAVDLIDRPLVLFVDAEVGLAAPWQLRPVRAGGCFGPSSHAISPASVLDVYRRVYGHDAPPAYVLTIAGYAFALGAPLSDAARANLEQAWPVLKQLCLAPSIERWQAMARLA